MLEPFIHESGDYIVEVDFDVVHEAHEIIPHQRFLFFKLVLNLFDILESCG